MSFYKQYTSPLGYVSNGNPIDTYGVDHSGFTTRDELAYQTARINRENDLMTQMNNQGITSYPQYTTNFWGTNADNNYGFGTSNIGSNIENIQQTSQPQPTSSDPNCYIEFDGKNVNLYKYGQYDGNKLVNGQLQYNLDGQSGGDDYQNRASQNIPNKGPIPEGTYWANQDQRQSLNLKNIALKMGEKLGINTNQKSNWSGNPTSWGVNRVWLQPDKNTNTYGRDGFTIHGGWSKGSRGCIDIPWQTKQLSDYLDNCQDSVPVYVKYPKENW